MRQATQTIGTVLLPVRVMKRMRQAPQTFRSFTYPWKLWRDRGKYHRPSVQFYLPMKIMKRMRQAPQTMGRVLPPHESHEENAAGNTDQFYLPKKVVKLLQLLLDFFDDHLAVRKLQLARRSLLQSRPKHNRFWTTQASKLQRSSFMIINSTTAVCISWEGMDSTDKGILQFDH